MELDDVDRAFVDSMLPDEGAIPTGLVAVVGYMAADGTDRITYFAPGGQRLSDMIGMLELAKQKLVLHNFAWQYAEGEDDP